MLVLVPELKSDQEETADMLKLRNIPENNCLDCSKVQGHEGQGKIQKPSSLEGGRASQSLKALILPRLDSELQNRPECWQLV